MFQQLYMLFKDNKKWMVLGGYFIVSLLLSVIIILIDTRIIPIQNYIPIILFTTVELAKEILGLLAGVLLTITTFTFSTILIVLTMYSSQFSPRVVENFLTNKITMKVLGIYVGGFLYSIINLLFMKNADSSFLVIGATVAVLYSVLCIIYFIVFVYTVSSSIQANKLIERLHDDSMESINHKIEFLKDNERINHYSVEQYDTKTKILVKKNGYFTLINFGLIGNLIKDLDCRIYIDSNIGDYLIKNQKIAYLYTKAEVKEDLIKELSNGFSIGDERYSLNDYMFSIQKIVELALRAISTGINDPYTAIQCIRMIGALLGKMAQIEGHYTIVQPPKSKGAIIHKSVDFRKDIYFTFYQIVHYGKKDLSVILALFEALEIIKRQGTAYNQIVVKEFAEYIYCNSISEYSHKMDIDLLKERRNEFL